MIKYVYSRWEKFLLGLAVLGFALAGVSTAQMIHGMKKVGDTVIASVKGGESSTLPQVVRAKVAVNGDFTAGNLLFERIGNTVTVTGDGLLSHVSSSGPASLAGLIPEDFRPTDIIYNVYVTNSSKVGIILVDPNGTYIASYRNWSGVAFADTSTSITPSMTYLITD